MSRSLWRSANLSQVILMEYVMRNHSYKPFMKEDSCDNSRHESQTWWLMPIILALGSLGQEGHYKFEPILGCIMCSSSQSGTE